MMQEEESHEAFLDRVGADYLVLLDEGLSRDQIWAIQREKIRAWRAANPTAYWIWKNLRLEECDRN